MFARGKALGCETLPFVAEIIRPNHHPEMEETIRNATMLGVHAISHGANDKEGSCIDGRSMYVGGTGFQLASTIMENMAPLPPRWWVGGAGFQTASTMENIACKSQKVFCFDPRQATYKVRKIAVARSKD